MTSYTPSTTGTVPAGPRAHAKLHKRGGSGSASSLPGSSPYLAGARSHVTASGTTYEEPASLRDAASLPPTSSTPKIKPYLRKMSGNKDEDQGKLDLSKSVGDNNRLAGLGIKDFGPRSASASDVSFTPAVRRVTPHTRTTSVGSQVSTGSGSFRPNQQFVHPMRQTPRPYTPPAGSSSNSFVNEEEANESDDVVDDDFKLGHGFRSRRSMSITSTPQIAPTPLSQSHTADELGLVPKLTSTSQSNLSMVSAKSSKSKVSRAQREHSFDQPTSPSSRTSFDRAISYVSRRSDPEPETRDERIRVARRRFEEKEANKDRRLQKGALKRRATEEAKNAKKQERQARKSEASERARPSESSEMIRSSADRWKKTTPHAQSEKFRSRSYEEYRPANVASLPRKGREAGASEKVPRSEERRSMGAQSNWVRFSAWFQTRLLGCGSR